MQRVKISACLIVFIFAYALCSLFILKTENDRLKERLERVSAAYESGDTALALDAARELSDYWNTYERRVTLIIHDNYLREINMSIGRLPPFIESGNEETAAELNSIYRQVECIYKEEFPSWRNIL